MAQRVGRGRNGTVHNETARRRGEDRYSYSETDFFLKVSLWWYKETDYRGLNSLTYTWEERVLAGRRGRNYTVHNETARMKGVQSQTDFLKVSLWWYKETDLPRA